MPKHRNLLEDRRGGTETAIAALVSIAVILILMKVSSSPKGAEEVFWAEFGIAKWLATILNIDDYLKPFEEMLKYLQGSELWSLIVSILSIVCMIFSLVVTFVCTKATVGTTIKILAWKRRRREKRKRAIEEDRRQYELWREGLEREDEGDSSGLAGAFEGLFGYPTFMGFHGEAAVRGPLDQAWPRRSPYAVFGPSPEHRESVMQAITWLKVQDEPILRVDQYELDPETGRVMKQYGRPDLSTPFFIVECKLGVDRELRDIQNLWNSPKEPKRGFYTGSINILSPVRSGGRLYMNLKSMVIWWDMEMSSNG